MKVSVLIVNWNGNHLLESCLESLRRQSHAPHEVIVVDNGSTDGSVEFLRELLWPLLKTVFLPQNLGFSGGNNAGFAAVSGDILALMNNDVVADSEWIAAALSLFESERVGMVACKTLRQDDPGRIDKLGHLIYPDGLNRGRASGEPDDGRFDTVTEVLWPDGSAGFYRKSMVDEIGFFDDDFFLYGEDAELGMRALWAGYRCLFQPASKVWHRQSASLGRFSRRKVYYVERNRLWLLVKTFPLSWVFLSPWYTVWRYLMNLVSMLRGQGAAAEFQRDQSALSLLAALLAALWDGLRGLLHMAAKRKTILRRRTSRQMKVLLRRHRIAVAELTLND